MTTVAHQDDIMRASSEIVGRISRVCFVPARLLTPVSQLGAVAFAWCLVRGSWFVVLGHSQNVGLNWPAKKRIATRIGRGLEVGAVLVETKAPLRSRWKSARAISKLEYREQNRQPGRKQKSMGNPMVVDVEIPASLHLGLDRDLTLNHWQPPDKVAVSRFRRP